MADVKRDIYEKLRIKMAKKNYQLKLKFKRCRSKSCVQETLNLRACGDNSSNEKWLEMVLKETVEKG